MCSNLPVYIYSKDQRLRPLNNETGPLFKPQMFSPPKTNVNVIGSRFKLSLFSLLYVVPENVLIAGTSLYVLLNLTKQHCNT